MSYRAIKNLVVDDSGKQIVLILPVNCSMKVAREIAAFVAQQLAHHDRDQERRAAP